MNKISLTDIGLVREKNQDSIFASDEFDLPLFIIADGMGGHKGGEIASKTAIENIKAIFLKNKKKLVSSRNIIKTIEEALQKSNTDIHKKSLKTLEYSGMGTTVSLCYIYESYVYIGHVGDSRIYKITSDNIIQLTEDHSLTNELLKKGEITAEEALSHPQKNIITRAVGSSPCLEVDIEKVNLKNTDSLLLCTDGLYNMVEDNKILEIFKENTSLKVTGNKLVNQAKNNGGYDNISLILIGF